jgi:hypothetical protein
VVRFAGGKRDQIEVKTKQFLYSSVSQPLGRGPVLGPGINYTGPRVCHFSFLSIFHELIYFRGNILRRIIFVNVSKSSDPERLNNICVANVSDQAAYF